MVERTQMEFALLDLDGLPEAFVELSSAMANRPDSRQEAAREFSKLLYHTGELAVIDGWMGLLDICSLIAEQLEVFSTQPEVLNTDVVSACGDWAGLLQSYLNQPQDTATSEALIGYLCQPCWNLAIEPGHAEDMLQMLGFIPADDAGFDDYSSLPESSNPDGLLEPHCGEVDALDLMAAFAEDIGSEELADLTGLASLETEDEPRTSNTDGIGEAIIVDYSIGLVSELDVDVDSAWTALESLADSESVDASLEETDPLVDIENDRAGVGVEEEALMAVHDGTGGLADISAGALQISIDIDEPAFSALMCTATDNISPADFESMLDLDVEDSLKAFADELVADELASADLVADEVGLPEGVSQLLSILIDELPQIEVALREWLGLLASSDVAEEIQVEACAMVQELFGRLQVASESMGLLGLSQTCDFAVINLAMVDGDQDQSHWVAILSLLRDYLNEPLKVGTADSLVSFLSNARLPAAITDVEATELLRALSQPDFSHFEEEIEERLQEATVEHVSLEVGDDVSAELLDGLLQELPQFCEEFSLAIQRLIAGGSMDDMHEAQRIAHTIKGASNVVGVRGVAELTHHLEDILIVLAKYETLPASALAEALIKASDCLESMSDALQGFSSAPDNAQQVLQEVLDWANLIDLEGPPDPSLDAGADVESVHEAESLATTSRVDEVGSSTSVPGKQSVENIANVTAPSSSATANAEEARESKSEGAILRVSAGLVDDLLRLVGEATILNAQLRERVEQTKERAQLLDAQLGSIHQLGAELEELVDIKDFSNQREDDSHFDALEMDQYNELHSYSRRMIEAAVDAKEMGEEILGELDKLDDIIVTQGQLNSETHEGVLKTRMVSVDSVFARLQRCVRQTCRTTGKQVDLILSGGDTMMDSEVLRDVVDPVMHLLRNAIDHGIESADSRVSAGKSANGNLELGFFRDGNHILVRCKDDGAGLDYDAIRVAAVRDGLIDADVDIAEDELKRMVLRPNFTTRGAVTQVSGRGIGLNAVYGQVIGLKGSLQLDSVKGEGCTMDIRLPVTLLSTHALLVRVDQQTYGLATRGVERIVHAEDGEFSFFGGELVYRLDHRPYRVRRLSNVLGLEAEATDGIDQTGSVILMEIDDRVEAVVVDEVIGSRELVVKTLGQYMPKLTGIVGATILGDGQVSPVLDLVEMLMQPIAFEQCAINEYGRVSSEVSLNQPIAMVVDDSLSARRALSQLLSDAGYAVKTARDGLEAVDLLGSVRPDIMFVDMEMPRMNGIELTSHLRSRGGFEELPVVMITSRSTEKHRHQAENAGVNLYLTKPYSDDKLLAQIEYLTGSFA